MIKLCIFVALSALLVLTAAVHAQQPPPDASAGEEAEVPAGKKPSRLRVWVFPGQSVPKGSIITALGADGSSLALGSAAAHATGNAYRDMPPSKYSFSIKDGDKVLFEKLAQLAPAMCQTLIAGKWRMEIYEDNATSPNSAARSLRLMNFAKDANLSVVVGSSQTVKIGPDSLRDIKLPAKVTLLDVAASRPGASAPARTLSEVDLVSSPAAYVLVFPDYRGRLRPQIIEAGEAPSSAEQ
jgi:hypothetical protein